MQEGSKSTLPSISQTGISPTGLGYGTITPTHKTSTTHSAITDQAGLSHINTENFNQPEVQDELNQIITNDFNKEQVLTELGAQVTITQAFDAERRAIRSEFAKKAEDYRKQAEELPQGSQERTELETKAKQINDNLRIFDGITSALYAPNSNGIIGDVSRTVSPELAYRIGQAFKNNELKNQTDNGSRPEEQSLQHLLAHAVLGAAVSYSTGNDITTGTISAVSNEAGAKVLANYLYQGKDPKDLTQEQKDTIVSILNLATATAIYTATDGSTTDAVGGAEIGKVGVENNNDARFYGHPSDRIQISNEEALVIKEAFSIALPVLDSLELANAYKNAKTDAEKQAVLASALQIPVNKAGKVLKAVKSGKKANIQKEVKAVQAEQRKATQTKATCTNGTVCFTAGTLIETSEGLKAIETFTGGELIWTRNDITLEYGYRPVVATKATPNQPIFQVTVKNHQGDIETLQTTAEHPFWIKDTGWLKASLLEQGMILLDRNNQEVEVISQYLLPNHTDTVYNIEVDDFHTYHVGRLGVWVHNADCCEVIQGNVGGNRQWDSNLNSATNKPNAKYEVSNGTHTHVYYTDSQGRVNKVEGRLSLNKMPRNTSQQVSVGKAVNPTGDEGGHLIASILGGAGDRINMVPQAQRLNRSDWKKMENELARELNAGKSVSVKIDVGYPQGNSVRPNQFLVTATLIFNGKKEVRSYPFSQ